MFEETEITDIPKQEEKAHRIAALIAGYIHHALTVEEHDELDQWVGENDRNMILFEELTDERATQQALDWLADADGPRMLKKIKGALVFAPPRRRLLFWHYAVAASVIVLLGLTIFMWNKGKTETPAVVKNEKQDLAPGRDQASLTLADGSIILLDPSKNGKLAEQGSSDISNRDGQLSYNTRDDSKLIEPLMNTVTTPRGGTYPLTLSDGTKVWLNAASSITFPAVFTGNERRVVITGEVYFEVKPLAAAVSGKRPFIVEIKGRGMAVEVMGTHFNINAYSDEPTIKTTLLEGAVKVSATGKTSFLKPEQQAEINKSGELRTSSNVDLMKVMAWKDRLFRFTDDDIKSIMRQVSRWYDVDVVYDGKESMQTYNCLLSRDMPASKLFDVLQETGGVHFRIEGKKVTVLP